MPARPHRVTRGDDYRRIVREGRRVGGAFCVTHAVLHSADPLGGDVLGDDAVPGPPLGERPARFGFIVSKAVGGAVVRNLVRRRLKAIADRRLADGFTGADVVFRALPASATAGFAELEREVSGSLERIRRSGGRDRQRVQH